MVDLWGGGITEEEDIRKARIPAAEGVAKADITGSYNLTAAQEHSRGALEAEQARTLGAARRDEAKLQELRTASRTEGLGDIGRSYGGGQFDLAAIQRARDTLAEAGDVRGVEGVGAEGGPINVLRGEKLSKASKATRFSPRFHGSNSIHKLQDERERAGEGKRIG
jgi:hypothetical protein